MAEDQRPAGPAFLRSVSHRILAHPRWPGVPPGRLLRKADAASFEFIPAHFFIARDAHAVYHAWTRQTSIDRDSFRQCGAYWLDNHAVYFEYETSLKALAGADCTTFRDLGGGYGADDHGGWY